MRVTVQKTHDHITMIAGNPEGTFVAVGAKTRVWQSEPWAWIATGEDRAELQELNDQLFALKEEG